MLLCIMVFIGVLSVSAVMLVAGLIISDRSNSVQAAKGVSVISVFLTGLFIICAFTYIAYLDDNGYSKWKHVMKFIQQDHVTVFEEDDKVTKVVINPGGNVEIEDDGKITVYPPDVESE